MPAGMGYPGGSEMAMAGSALGPIGALAGAGLGTGASLADDLSTKNKQKKRQKRLDEEQFGKHRKLKKINDAVSEQHQRKLTSTAGLSQAAMDWAQMIR